MVFGKKKQIRGRAAQHGRRRRSKGRARVVMDKEIAKTCDTSNNIKTGERSETSEISEISGPSETSPGSLRCTGATSPEEFTTVCPKCCTDVTISPKIIAKHATAVADGNTRAAAHWEQEMTCGACRDDPGRVARWHKGVAGCTEYHGSFETWGREYSDVADLAATELTANDRVAARHGCDGLGLGRTRSGGSCSLDLVQIELAAEQSPRSRPSSPVSHAPPSAMRICHTCGEVFRGAKTLKRLRLHVKGRRNPCYRPNTEHHDCKVPVHLRSATDFEIDVHTRTEVWTTVALCIQAAWRRFRMRCSDWPYENQWILQERLRSAPAWHPVGDPMWRDGALLDMAGDPLGKASDPLGTRSDLMDTPSDLLTSALSPPVDRPGSPVVQIFAGSTKPCDDVFVVLPGRDPSQRLEHPVPLVLDDENDESAPLARGESEQASVMWTRESFRDIGLPPSALMGQ